MTDYAAVLAHLHSLSPPVHTNRTEEDHAVLNPVEQHLIATQPEFKKLHDVRMEARPPLFPSKTRLSWSK